MSSVRECWQQYTRARSIFCTYTYTIHIYIHTPTNHGARLRPNAPSLMLSLRRARTGGSLAVLVTLPYTLLSQHGSCSVAPALSAVSLTSSTAPAAPPSSTPWLRSSNKSRSRLVGNAYVHERDTHPVFFSVKKWWSISPRAKINSSL